MPKKKQRKVKPVIDQDIELRKIKAMENQTQMAMQILEMGNRDKQEKKYALPVLMDGIVPKGEKAGISMDSCSGVAAYANRDPQFYSGFLGYPTLSMMAQSSDYRMVGETTALEMTREFGKVKVHGDGDEEIAEKIPKIEQKLKELKVRDLMRQHIYNELTFGSSHLYIDLKDADPALPFLETTIKRGSFKALRLIEPIHATPSAFNASEPLREDFYKPTEWYVLGERIHADRLLTLVMRPVPDLLKPAYNFGGLSMMQLMKPYVERWERTVDSVSDLIHAFSLTGLKTSMSNVLEGGEDGMSQLVLRAQMFGFGRDNLNTLLVDKESEELFQINTPLTTLDALVTKAQEQMAMPAHTPLVKLTGITPSGLNASSDGEIRVYNDWISSLQEAFIRPQINKIMNLIQMDLYGEINENIVFEFNSLHQLTELERADVNLKKAQEAQVYITEGVVSQEEARKALSNEEFGSYGFIDPSEVPDPPLDFGDEPDIMNQE